MGSGEIKGHYDLVRMISIQDDSECVSSSPFDACPESSSYSDADNLDLAVIPASDQTRNIVVRMMRGDTIRISKRDDGSVSLWAEATGDEDSKKELVILRRADDQVQHEEAAEEPAAVARKTKIAARKTQKRPALASDKPTSDDNRASEGSSPRKIVIKGSGLFDGSLGSLRKASETVPAKQESHIVLSPGKGKDFLMPGGFAEMLRVIEEKNKIQGSCYDNECVCIQRPCIPCGLNVIRSKGATGALWAATWIIWYTYSASESERQLALKHLTREEKSVLREYKHKWNFAESVDSPIPSMDYENGKIPRMIDGFALRIPGPDEKIVAKKSSEAASREEDARKLGESLLGALKTAYDFDAEEGERKNALRFLAHFMHIQEIRTAVKKLAMASDDKQPEVRALAMQILEDFRENASKERS